MKAFTDEKGRSWEIELNIRQMKRVRDILGVDLVNVIQTNKDGSIATDTIDRVANDPILLCDILWVLCEQQAKLAGVTDEDFGSSLAGDSIETATRAFLDELVDFFPGARRLILKKAVGLAGERGGGRRGARKPGVRGADEDALESAWRLAGIAGVDPSPLTLRELGLMADGRAKFEWGIASSLMALLANLNRDPKRGKPLKPSDFNPFTPEPPKVVLRGAEMKEALKAAFCRGGAKCKVS